MLEERRRLFLADNSKDSLIAPGPRPSHGAKQEAIYVLRGVAGIGRPIPRIHAKVDLQRLHRLELPGADAEVAEREAVRYLHHRVPQPCLSPKRHQPLVR